MAAEKGETERTFGLVSIRKTKAFKPWPTRKMSTSNWYCHHLDIHLDECDSALDCFSFNYSVYRCLFTTLSIVNDCVRLTMATSARISVRFISVVVLRATTNIDRKKKNARHTAQLQTICGQFWWDAGIMIIQFHATDFIPFQLYLDLLLFSTGLLHCCKTIDLLSTYRFVRFWFLPIDKSSRTVQVHRL